jgi:predicted short-subunit dehydrogenase-like oxidoreductase (DUF2520 family)
MQRVAIIGAGVVGTAMGYLLRRSGYPIVAIASRKIESAEKARRSIGEGEATADPVSAARKADIVFITTPDDAIEEVCKRVASEGGFNPGAIVFHMSGALSSEVLGSARKAGAKIGSLHPLQSLADVNEAVKNIPNSYFCIEGDKDAITLAKEIVSSIGGKEITIEVEKKPLYHAGASVASNFLIATIRFGMELFEAVGIKREDSLNALIPLIRGTMANIENLGIPQALTGPISRGDTGIVEDHLKAIAKEREELINLYIELGRYTVKVAIEKGGIKKEEAERILSLFDKYDKYHGGKEIIYAHNR